MNYDKILDNIFFIGDKYNLSKIISYNKLKYKKYTNIHNYIINRFNDSLSERETIYRIHYNINQVPLCPICGNKLKFYGRKNIIFLSHCSNKCKRKDNIVLNKWKLSCGDIGTNRDKAKKTMINKYGVENPYQIPEIINKIKENNKIKKEEIINKMKITCLKKYGVEYSLQDKNIKEKSKQTCLKKYGCQYAIQNEQVKAKYNWKDITNKIYLTKKKNNSFHISKPERESFKLLQEKYPDVISQYKSELYPFNCDFYIPSLDLYIECNYHWSHGKHSYNENNLEDQNQLKKWQSKNTKYYNTIIYVWTNLDVKKRNIAKQNNLNYLIFWNIGELKEWLNNKKE